MWVVDLSDISYVLISQYSDDHWDFDASIFLKIDRFEGAKPHSPLKHLDYQTVITVHDNIDDICVQASADNRVFLSGG